LGALVRIVLYNVDSRPGRVLLMMPCALSIAPLQLLIHPGLAHSVITPEKPASLPPTEIVTNLVALDSVPSCPLVTELVVAPEQAWKLSV
jgi:hypothetical protein